MAAHMKRFQLLFVNSKVLFPGGKGLCSSSRYILGRSYNVLYGKEKIGIGKAPNYRCSSVISFHTQPRFNSGSKSSQYWSLMFIPLSVKALFGLEDEAEETPEEILIKHIKRSILLIQQGENRQAEQLLHVTLKMAQDQKNENGITYIYDILANLAFDNDDFRKAEPLFISTMQRLLISGVPQNDLKIIHISLKLAKIYEELGDATKSDQGYQFCLENLESRVKSGTADEDTLNLQALSLHWYAQLFLKINKPDKALKLLNEAYDISVKVTGYDHEHTVLLLSEMGRASNLEGDQDAAANYFERALKVAQVLEEVPPISHVMVNLGMVNLFRKMYEEGNSWCEMGLKQAKQEKNQFAYDQAKHCLKELKSAVEKERSS